MTIAQPRMRYMFCSVKVPEIHVHNNTSLAIAQPLFELSSFDQVYNIHNLHNLHDMSSQNLGVCGINLIGQTIIR